MIPYALRRRLATLSTLARLERAAPGPLRANLLRRGLLSNRAALYPLETTPLALFLTDWEIEARLPGLNAPAAQALFGDKFAFHAAAARGAIEGPVPRLVARIERGRCIVLAHAPPPYVVKPRSGSGGRGVSVIWSLSDAPGDGDHVVEARLEPHPRLAPLSPTALPTLRILTARAGSAPPKLLGAVHRFARAASGATDNFKSGGIVAGVDPETGRLRAAISLTRDGHRAIHPHHPETAAPIEGVVLPAWPDAVSLALECAYVPGIAYAGWDIALTASGPVLVEGNAWLANPNIVQAHRALLADPDTADILVQLGVISARRHRAAARARACAAATASGVAAARGRPVEA